MPGDVEGLTAPPSSDAVRHPLLVAVGRHLGVLGGLVVALPLVAAAIRVRLLDGYAPYADIPLIELAVRDVGRHPVLVGAYSRFGWFHPGPLPFYLLAVPYRLLGSTATSLLAAAALVNAATVVAIGWLARRVAGLAGLGLVLAGTALVLHTVGPAQWVDPWNPSIVVLPFLLFVLAAWGFAAGDDLCLPVAVAAGTFCLQGHAGYLPFVGLVGITAVAGRVLWSRRGARDDPASGPSPQVGGDGRVGDPHRRRLSLRAALLVGAAVGAVLWLPPLVDQVTNEPGNLRQILAFSRDVQPVNTIGDGARFVAFELGVPPAWLVGLPAPGWLNLIDTSSPPVPIAAVGLAIVAAVAVVRRDRLGVRLVALAGAALVAGVVAVSRFADGGVLPYLVEWSPIVGLVAWLAVALVAWRALRPRLPEAVRTVAAILVVTAVVVTSLVNLAAAVDAKPGDAARGAEVLALTDALEPSLARDRPVQVLLAEPSGGVESLWTANGVVAELERRGYDVRVPATEVVFGHRADPSGADQVVGVRRLDGLVPRDWEGRDPVATAGELAVYLTRRG